MRQNIFFVSATILLACVIAGSWRYTVQAQRRGAVDMNEELAHAAEMQYEMQIKEDLQAQHLTNSGVMMTKVIYEGGRREYTVRIHNRQIGSMSSCERTQLRQRLDALVLALPDSHITYRVENE